MCAAPQGEHEACSNKLGYCPYCEEPVSYPAAPDVPVLGIPQEILELSDATLVINGQ